MTNVAILGAGALGLAAARRLVAGGARVTVFEREPGPGGLGAGARIRAIWLGQFNHHGCQNDRPRIALIEELGLGQDVVWGGPPTAVLRAGTIRRLDGPLEVLTFSPLSIPARLRLGLGVAILKAIP